MSGLESATYIGSLSPSNPAAGDPRSQGDDHLRLLKAVLQATFPNATKQFYFPTTTASQTADPAPACPTDWGKQYPCNAASAAFSITLPTSGLVDGYTIEVMKTDFGPNALTINAGSKTVNGLTTVKITKPYQNAIIRYASTLDAWLMHTPIGVPTGSFLDNPATTVEGYIICDGTTTIGNGSSGASTAAVNTSALFQLLWNSFSNTVCAVSTGRGATAAADYAANKKITMPDLRGRTRYGKDNMGGSAASRITTAIAGFDGTTMGASGGAQSISLAEANLPSLTKTLSATFTGTAVAAHRHEVFQDITASGASPTVAAATSASRTFSSGSTTNEYAIKSDGSTEATLGQTSANGGFTPAGTIAGTVAFGSGTAYGIVSPGFITNVFMAL